MDDKLYEINIKRFIQSAEYQLKKLNDCINRLNEFQDYEDWKNVKQAHLNASQIIKRIKSDIKEIEKIRSQVLAQLDNKSSNQIINQIDEQLKCISKKLQRETDEIDSISAPYYKFQPKNQDIFMESNCVSPDVYSYQVEKNEFLAQDKELCNSYEQLVKDCDDLKYLMETFANELYKQKPTIDSIEKNVLVTKENIEEGSSNLKLALTYKTFGTAASGAFIGTLIGGPIGLLAGAKIGAVVGVSGGVFGYLLGKRVNKPDS